MIFATLGDKNYYRTIYMNCERIKKFHNASVYIADLGGLSGMEFPDNAFVVPFYGLDADWYKMQMKPLFLLYCLQYGDVCLMDGDAVLIKPLDLFIDGDAIVTVRQSRHGRINSGVVLCNSIDFASAWMRHALSLYSITDHRLSEQNALIDICDSGFFSVHEVPCDEYNYSSVEKGIPDHVRIVHLKSGRFLKDELIKLIP